MSKQNTDADVEFVKALAEILHDNDLTELEVERGTKDAGKLSVRVSRGGPVQAFQVAAQPAPAPAPAPAGGGGAPAPAAEKPASNDPAALPGVVKSPMVGTVYLSPEPGADAFVKLGDVVSEGQTLLIVEAMKTMNQIPAPRAGTVKRILIEDASPVEYGAPLMIIE